MKLLQVCPNDHPPFADICRTYDLAVTAVGGELKTIFLGPPTDRSVPGAIYLNKKDLSDTRDLRVSLAEHVDPDALTGVISHRYRAYRALPRMLNHLPTVVVVHEFGFFKRQQRRVQQIVERRIRSGKLSYAAVSNVLADDLRSVVPQPLVLPNVVDLPRAIENLLPREEAREALGVEAPGRVIGVVGRLHVKKQPEVALRVFDDVCHQSDRLVFVGDGDLRRKLESSAGKNVVFAGRVQDAARYFSAFDALLVASRDIEAFARVVLEAMVAAVPVVCRAPAPREILGDLALPGTLEEQLGAVLAGDVPADWAERAMERVRADFSVPSLSARLQDVFSQT